MEFPKFPVQKAYKAAMTPCPCCYTYSGLVALSGLYLSSMVLSWLQRGMALHSSLGGHGDRDAHIQCQFDMLFWLFPD